MSPASTSPEAGKLGTVTARQQFVDEIAGTFGGRGLEDLDADWAQQTTSADRAIADLIVALDPTIAPVVNDWDVSADGLPGLARAALEDDKNSRSARKIIDVLFDGRVLAVFAHLDGHGCLWDIDRSWCQATDDLQHHLERADANGVRIDLDHTGNRAILLGACGDDAFLEHLTAQRDQALRDHPTPTPIQPSCRSAGPPTPRPHTLSAPSCSPPKPRSTPANNTNVDEGRRRGPSVNASNANEQQIVPVWPRRRVWDRSLRRSASGC